MRVSWSATSRQTVAKAQRVSCCMAIISIRYPGYWQMAITAASILSTWIRRITRIAPIPAASACAARGSRHWANSPPMTMSGSPATTSSFWPTACSSCARAVAQADGTLWLHCDHRMQAPLLLLLAEIFGPDSHLNTVFWRSQTMRGAKVHARYFPHSAQAIHIFRSTPRGQPPWNAPKREFVLTEEDGRRAVHARRARLLPHVGSLEHIASIV